MKKFHETSSQTFALRLKNLSETGKVPNPEIYKTITKCINGN